MYKCIIHVLRLRVDLGLRPRSRPHPRSFLPYFPDCSSQILITRLRGTNRAEERVDEEPKAQSPELLSKSQLVRQVATRSVRSPTYARRASQTNLDRKQTVRDELICGAARGRDHGASTRGLPGLIKFSYRRAHTISRRVLFFCGNFS